MTPEESNTTRILTVTRPEDDETAVFDLTAELPRKSNERYKFIRSIGFGGMKAVLLVHDCDTGRDAAMAMMPDFRSRPQSDVIRFVREAKICAMLEHPNIVPVHDMGTDMSGAPFFTMKYLRGQSLSTLLRKVKNKDGELSIDDALQIYIRVCNAVAFAHAQGILHLDIKPDNVNVGNFGEVVLLDWGLAAQFRDDVELVRDLPRSAARDMADGYAKGTPGFMSPEQARGKNTRLDERADIYALGALLYTILVLHYPLSGTRVDKVLSATIHGQVPPPSESNYFNRPVPEALEAICRKAMALKPADRYKSVAELRNDIQAFREGYAPEAQNASPLMRTALFVNRNFMETVMAAIIVALAAALLYVILN